MIFFLNIFIVKIILLLKTFGNSPIHPGWYFYLHCHAICSNTAFQEPFSRIIFKAGLCKAVLCSASSPFLLQQGAGRGRLPLCLAACPVKAQQSQGDPASSPRPGVAVGLQVTAGPQTHPNTSPPSPSLFKPTAGSALILSAQVLKTGSSNLVF